MGVSAACGAINGVAAASGIQAFTAGGVGAATGFVESLCHELIDNDGTMNDESWSAVATNTGLGFFGGLIGGKGAINGNKYMTQQVSRFAKHTATDGLKAAGNFYYKMTANYSKQFVAPTFLGIARGHIGARVVNQFDQYITARA